MRSTQSGITAMHVSRLRLVHLILVALFGSGLSGASAAPGGDGFSESVVWAINLGGGSVVSRSGERFDADVCNEQHAASPCQTVEDVHRTQSPALHRSYRVGDQHYEIDLADGRYDVVLFFVEPPGRAGEARVMDIAIEGRRVLTHLTVPEAPPRQAHGAMTRGFPAIEVVDGTLDVAVEGRRGKAVLSALLVRRSEFSTKGWQLVWEEDFDDPATLGTRWTAEEWGPGRVNEEEQAYTTEPENVRIEEGVLILEAHRTGVDDPAYTSGRVHSWGHRAFRYGRLDIRARVPEGRGVWPALWLLPDDPYRYATTCHSELREWQGDDDCDAWPNSGEIDLMEHIGYEPRVVHGTVHTSDYYSRHGNQVQGTVVVPDLGEAFHTYSLVWREGALAMYVDGVRYFAYFDDGTGPGQWPFDHAFHIVMNLAVGGAWGAAHEPE